MTDVADRLGSIRERVEAATEGLYGDRQARFDLARSDVPYLLSLVGEVGGALASLSDKEIDRVMAAVEVRCTDEQVEALAQVRDAALKAEYDAALRDAAQKKQTEDDAS